MNYRELAEHFERVRASKWATEPWRDPRKTDALEPRPVESKPTPSTEHARLVRKTRDLNPWLTVEQAHVVAEAWSKMIPPSVPPTSRPPRRNRRRRRVKVRYVCPICRGPHSSDDHREAA